MNGNICDAIATFGPLFIEESSRLVSTTTGGTVAAKVAGSAAVRASLLAFIIDRSEISGSAFTPSTVQTATGAVTGKLHQSCRR